MFRAPRLAARSLSIIAACYCALAATSLPTLARDVPRPRVDYDLRLLVPDGFRSAMLLPHDIAGRGYR